MASSRMIGIDLGTLYSCVGVWKNNKVEILTDEECCRTIPSYVAFTPTGRKIGADAMRQSALNLGNTVFDTKRLIGRAFDDPYVQLNRKYWPFGVIRGNSGEPLIIVTEAGEKKLFLPKEISAMVLTRIRGMAETYLGHPVTSAVISVPAYFNAFQRQATRDAAIIAGLNFVRLITETNAAAAAYAAETEEKCVVFNLGASSVDVSVITQGYVIEVEATTGNTHIGGNAFDTCLVDYCVQDILQSYEKDVSTDWRVLSRLWTSCRTAKETLSMWPETKVEIDSLFDGCNYSCTISRTKFEELCDGYFQSCLHLVSTVLFDARTPRQEIDKVVLVGGSTRIPKVQSLIAQYFDGKQICTSINPDEAVAIGAAATAALLDGVVSVFIDKVLVLDAVALSLGIETAGGVLTPIVERNMTIPLQKRRTFTTCSDNQRSALIRVFQENRVLMKDDTLLGKILIKAIKRAPPAVTSEYRNMFTTNGTLSEKYQLKVFTSTEHEHEDENPNLPPICLLFHLLFPNIAEFLRDCKRLLTKHHILIGSFLLSGIPPAPRGVLQIEVTFDIDGNRDLKISAVETSAGTAHDLTIFI